MTEFTKSPETNEEDRMIRLKGIQTIDQLEFHVQADDEIKG